jgi:hypothetical protein
MKPMKYRPWTWKAPGHSEDVKRSITRQDAFERVSGQAAYTRDLYLPGMLYAKILLSPYSSASIVGIDAREAAALKGVRDILRYDDPDIEIDSVQGSLYDSSPHYNILTLPRTPLNPILQLRIPTGRSLCPQSPIGAKSH